MAGAFTSCSEQGAELPGKLFGVRHFLQPCLWLGILPFPGGQFTLSLIARPVYIAGSLGGEVVPPLASPPRVEVGSSFLLGAGILDPWLSPSPSSPGWRSKSATNEEAVG